MTYLKHTITTSKKMCGSVAELNNLIGAKCINLPVLQALISRAEGLACKIYTAFASGGAGVHLDVCDNDMSVDIVTMIGELDACFVAIKVICQSCPHGECFEAMNKRIALMRRTYGRLSAWASGIKQISPARKKDEFVLPAEICF